jgi:hypothetical protein
MGSSSHISGSVAALGERSPKATRPKEAQTGTSSEARTGFQWNAAEFGMVSPEHCLNNSLYSFGLVRS